MLVLVLFAQTQRNDERRSRQRIQIRIGDSIVIHPDSQSMCWDQLQGFSHHVFMAKLLEHQYTRVQGELDVRLTWTQGHSNGVANILADTAIQGTKRLHSEAQDH